MYLPSETFQSDAKTAEGGGCGFGSSQHRKGSEILENVRGILGNVITVDGVLGNLHSTDAFEVQATS